MGNQDRDYFFLESPIERRVASDSRLASHSRVVGSTSYIREAHLVIWCEHSVADVFELTPPCVQQTGSGAIELWDRRFDMRNMMDIRAQVSLLRLYLFIYRVLYNGKDSSRRVSSKPTCGRWCNRWRFANKFLEYHFSKNLFDR